MTPKSGLLAMILSGLITATTITAAFAADGGKTGSGHARAIVQSTEISFKKNSVTYEALPVDDQDITSLLNSLSDIVSKKHYQLRQDRDL